jgi:hypothetical protein
VISENAGIWQGVVIILKLSNLHPESTSRSDSSARPTEGRKRFLVRALHFFTGVSAAVALLLTAGCYDFNPYLGATPTVSSSITSITPSGATANPNHADILMTVNGSGFVLGSVVTWNNSGGTSTNLVSNVLSSTQVQANIPGSLLATPGTYSVGVIAPGPTSGNNAGNNISNFVPFIVCGSTCPSVVPSPSAKFANFSAVPSASSAAPKTQAPLRYQALVADSADGSIDTETGIAKIFLHDSCAGAAGSCTPQMIPVSIAWNGADPNGASDSPAATADGRFVVFASAANNLVKGDSNGWSDIFLRDTCIGAGSVCFPTTTRVSVAPDGTEGNGPSYSPAISFDGRFIIFCSSATNLVRPDSVNSLPATSNPPLFLRDTCFGAPRGCVPATSRVVAEPASQR